MKNLLFLLTLSIGFLITSCSDPCKDITCSSVGTCDDGTCICDPGYTGANCETEMRAILLGEWQSLDFSCGGETGIEQVFVIESTSVVTEAIFYLKDEPDTKITGTVNDKVMTVTDFIDPETGTIFIGTVTLENDVLTMDFSIQGIGITYSCSGTSIKI